MKRLLLMTFAVLALGAPAKAATVDVRIEGQSSTLFEGSVVTNGRNVQSISERSSGAIRRCDGTNNSGSTTIVPTATAATADALSIQGQGFDGDWFDEFDDYLVYRLGDEVAEWRLFQNGAFSDKGGCQRVGGLTRVLWANQPGNPVAMSQASEGSPSLATEASATIYVAGADGSKGPTLGNADGNGNYTVVGLGAGWHRVKAELPGRVRSSRANVCVSPCGGKPADMLPRTPPAPVFYGPGGRTLPNGSSLAANLAAPRLSRPRAGRSAYRRGRIAVDWRTLSQGVGLLRWTIASDDLTTRDVRWVTRARGTSSTSALLALPAGRAHALRFTATDRLQRDDSTDFGRVLVPIDDRAKAVKRRGPWRRARSSNAWKGTLLRGRAGARLKVKLAAGRPALVTAGRKRATVKIGSKTVRVRGGRTAYGAKRRKAGSVTIRVVRGSVDLDGLAAAP